MPEETALVEGVDFYMEGAAFVFTASYHLRRGHCCSNDCRHCPYREESKLSKTREEVTTDAMRKAHD